MIRLGCCASGWRRLRLPGGRGEARTAAAADCRHSNGPLRRPHPLSHPRRRPSFPTSNPSRLPRPGRTAQRNRPGTRPRRRRRPCRNPTAASRKRIGTRWVVWVGGLTLALGGFFMVRYSIEAGLLGPGVRMMLGGLFALALLAAGEWTRRKESISDDRGAADRQYPGDPHRRRHGGGVCNGLRGLCAVRIPGARHRLRPARPGGDGHARRGTAARAGARRPRRRRRLRRRRSWFRPASRISGRSISISPIVTAAAFGLARIGCGAGLRSPPSCSRCSGPSPACNAARRWSAPHAFHVIAGFILAALLVVCGFMFGPPAERRRDRADLVRLARGLSARRHPDRAEQLSCRHRA